MERLRNLFSSRQINPRDDVGFGIDTTGTEEVKKNPTPVFLEDIVLSPENTEFRKEQNRLISNIRPAEVERITRQFSREEAEPRLADFLMGIELENECKHDIIKFAKENAYVIIDEENLITGNLEEFNNIVNKKTRFLNTLIPLTDLTYQELGLLLNLDLAKKIVDKRDPEYLKNRGSTAIHRLFRILPNEYIISKLRPYFKDCDINQSMRLLIIDMTLLLEKSTMSVYRLQISNERMVNFVIRTALSTLESNIANFNDNILTYFCTFVFFFKAQTENIRRSWTEFFIIDSITAYDITEKDLEDFNTVDTSKKGISCNKGVIERFFISLGLAIFPLVVEKREREEITFENFNSDKQGPLINDLRETLIRLTTGIWYNEFLEKNDDTAESGKQKKIFRDADDLETKWKDFFAGKWNSSVFTTRYDFPMYDVVKDTMIITTALTVGYDVLLLAGYDLDVNVGGKSRKSQKSRRSRGSRKRIKTNSRKNKRKYYLK